MKTLTLFIALFAAFLLLQGCAFHSTAKHWHGRMGADGEPVYYKSTTKVGLNLLVIFTLLGDTGVGGIIDDITAEIAEEDGDYVRIVQGSSENYWYGFPPLTWILTPVVSTVAADYRPSAEMLAKDLEEMRADEE
jgi:hypothetical protein